MKLFYTKNKEQIKSRNFEINSLNGFQISNYVKELEDYFTDTKDIIFYNDIDQLLTQISYYLENDIEREKIKLNGYRNSIKFTCRERFKELFLNIENW